MSPVEARLAHADGHRTTGGNDYGSVVWFRTGQRCKGYMTTAPQHSQMQREVTPGCWEKAGLAVAEHDSILGN
jgi:hypothetical protein